MSLTKSKRKRNGKALAKVIQKKSVEVLKKNVEKKKAKKGKFLISKEEKILRMRAKEYDELVHSLLEEQIHDTGKILIFNYQDGFTSVDKNNFGKYSIRL